MQNMMTYLRRNPQLRGLLSPNPYKGFRPWTQLGVSPQTSCTQKQKQNRRLCQCVCAVRATTTANLIKAINEVADFTFDRRAYGTSKSRISTGLRRITNVAQHTDSDFGGQRIVTRQRELEMANSQHSCSLWQSQFHKHLLVIDIATCVEYFHTQGHAPLMRIQITKCWRRGHLRGTVGCEIVYMCFVVSGLRYHFPVTY